MYYAILGSDEDEPSKISGTMNDCWGESTLTQFLLTETKLSFTKRYNHRPEIFYDFVKSKEEGIWIGEWSGLDCGKGTSKCWLVTLEESIFEIALPEKIVQAMEELK